MVVICCGFPIAEDRVEGQHHVRQVQELHHDHHLQIPWGGVDNDGRGEKHGDGGGGRRRGAHREGPEEEEAACGGGQRRRTRQGEEGGEEGGRSLNQASPCLPAAPLARLWWCGTMNPTRAPSSKPPLLCFLSSCCLLHL
ncbi:unnamed protein product [Musa textilis]